jgi:hypothetical protein
MVANWLDPVELVFPMFCLVVLVYAGFGLWVVCSISVEKRDRRNRAAHIAWMQGTQARMYESSSESAPTFAPASTMSFADVAQTVVLSDSDTEIILPGDDLLDIPLARTINLDDLPEQRPALALESRGGSDG